MDILEKQFTSKQKFIGVYSVFSIFLLLLISGIMLSTGTTVNPVENNPSDSNPGDGFTGDIADNSISVSINENNSEVFWRSNKTQGGFNRLQLEVENLNEDNSGNVMVYSMNPFYGDTQSDKFTLVNGVQTVALPEMNVDGGNPVNYFELELTRKNLDEDSPVVKSYEFQ